MTQEHVFISDIYTALKGHFPTLSCVQYESVLNGLTGHENAPRMWKAKLYRNYGTDICGMAVGIMAAELADIPIMLVKLQGLTGNALFSTREVLKELQHLCVLRLAGSL